MEQKFCQSCGMPLTEEIKGTNADGSRNEDYCIYCYKDGAFTRDCTMEEMIDFCAQFVDEVNKNMPSADRVSYILLFTHQERLDWLQCGIVCHFRSNCLSRCQEIKFVNMHFENYRC